MFAAAPSLRGFHRYLRSVRIASGLGGAALLLFHGWLFASQMASGRLSEPGLALRWLIAVALAAGLVGLYRSGESLWSRKGTAIWVLAAVLHGPAIAASSVDPSVALALPEAVATVVVQIVATSGSLALGLWILGWLLAAANRRAAVRLAPAASPVRPLTDPNRRPFSPRPPPRI